MISPLYLFAPQQLYSYCRFPLCHGWHDFNANSNSRYRQVQCDWPDRWCSRGLWMETTTRRSLSGSRASHASISSHWKRGPTCGYDYCHVGSVPGLPPLNQWLRVSTFSTHPQFSRCSDFYHLQTEVVYLLWWLSHGLCSATSRVMSARECTKRMEDWASSKIWS